MIITFLILVTLALIYIFIVRPILSKQPILSEAFKAEASFWDKMQAKITGWRTYIAAWLTTIAGIMVGLYDQVLPFVVSQDWTPVTAKLPSWSLPVGLVVGGIVFAWLRSITNNSPQLVVQKDDAGVPKVIDLIKPDGSSATMQAG